MRLAKTRHWEWLLSKFGYRTLGWIHLAILIVLVASSPSQMVMAEPLFLRVVGPSSSTLEGELRFNPGGGDPVSFGPILLPPSIDPFAEVFVPIPNEPFTHSVTTFTFSGAGTFVYTAAAFPPGGGPPMSLIDFLLSIGGGQLTDGPSMWWPRPGVTLYGATDMTQRLNDPNPFEDVEALGKAVSIVNGTTPMLSGYVFGTSPISIDFNTNTLVNPDPFTGDVVMDAFCQLTPIPEPSTWLLMGTGLAGLLGYSWWRRQWVA